MQEIEYLPDRNGKTKAVIIPIEIWTNLFPHEPDSLEEITETIEDYCLGKAMDEAQETPLLDIEVVLKYLEE